jgi:hypothetical protein
MSDITEKIEVYVSEEIKAMTPSQIQTLKALIFSGYKGEREHVLLELLKSRGGGRVSPSPLVESFVSAFEDGSATYWRIKPEFFRTVRRQLIK